MSGFSAINYALSKKLDSAILTGVVSHTVDDVNKSITFTFNDGTSSTIHFNSPTNVDVEETPIEINKTNLGLNITANHSKYIVINGICYVTIEVNVNAPSTNMSYKYKKINTTSLPIIGFNTKAILNVLNGENCISLVLEKGSTDIKLHGNILSKEGTYIIQGSFSYPVAE